MTTKILVLASNPQGTEQLKLNKEIRLIHDALQEGNQREKFTLKFILEASLDDLQKTIRREKPKIVHFCGHGMGNRGLVLATSSGQKQLLDIQAIADLFKLFANQVECVVLNACYSQFQAAEINQHINYVVGTKKEIRDDAAVAFTKGFYEALFDGDNIERAYEFGCNRIQLEIYGSSNHERKLVPIYSEAESKYIDLPQHENLILLKKAPLNSIESESEPNQINDFQVKSRGDNITRITNIYGGNYNENIQGNYYQESLQRRGKPFQAPSPDFQKYLESVCDKYKCWWNRYTLTDALGQKSSENEETTSPFDFEHIVQTLPNKQSKQKEEQEKTERMPVLEGIRKYASHHVLLIGKPGSGKSTALTRLLLEEAEQAISHLNSDLNQDQVKIPVLVELRYYRTSVLDLIRDWFKGNRLLLSRSEIETLLFQGRFLLLIDGLNEVPSTEAIRNLEGFRQANPTNPMIFTRI